MKVLDKDQVQDLLDSQGMSVYWAYLSRRCVFAL